MSYRMTRLFLAFLEAGSLLRTGSENDTSNCLHIPESWPKINVSPNSLVIRKDKKMITESIETAFEIPFTKHHALKLTGDELSLYTIVRLREFATAAAKLRKAGWAVWLTVAGLAFEPPRGLIPDDEDGCPDEDAAARELIKLGILEDFDSLPSYTLAEIHPRFTSP
jgi:hypothetical protein